MERQFEVRRPPGAPSPAIWSPRTPSTASAKQGPNPFFASNAVPSPNSPSAFKPVSPVVTSPVRTVMSPVTLESQPKWNPVTSPVSPDSGAPQFNPLVVRQNSYNEVPSPPPPPSSVAPPPPMAPPLPPPPPPPPPPNGGMPTWREQQKAAGKDQPSGYHPSQHATSTPQEGGNAPFCYLPPQLHGTALKKDKKPFTYTPGGLDLSQIRSPRMQKRIAANLQEDEDSPSEPSSANHHPPVMSQPQPANSSNQKKHQAYVLPAYNSPLNLYSQENAVDAYDAQTEQATRQINDLQLSGNQTSPANNHYRNNYDQPNQSDLAREFGQSRSFRILQMITADEEESAPDQPVQKKREEDEMRFTGLRKDAIPSRAFHTLQKMTGDDASPPPVPSHASSANNSGGQVRPPEDHTNYNDQPPVDLRYKGSYIPGKSFKMLQEMTGMSDDEVEAIPPPPVRQQQQKPRKTTSLQMQVGGPPPQKVYPHPEVPAREQEAESEPKMYTGGRIPGQSFRMLQAMTGECSPTGHGGTDF